MCSPSSSLNPDLRFQHLDNPIMNVIADSDQEHGDLVRVPISPITRARVKKSKNDFNGRIREIWAQADSLKHVEVSPHEPSRCTNLIQVLEDSN